VRIAQALTAVYGELVGEPVVEPSEDDDPEARTPGGRPGLTAAAVLPGTYAASLIAHAPSVWGSVSGTACAVRVVIRVTGERR
ncbi:hypothetical protein, partial [Pseudonocardia sp. ICBG601]|uniref:hypothetical protein n=1 Tax=Pseudonocardia sp. ICBG601 TaxID=2846759 RepID=UPI001CF6ADD4